MSSSGQAGYRKKDILVVGNSLTQGLENTAVTAEQEHGIYFTKQWKKCCLCLHYNVVDNYILVNVVEIYKFIAIDSEINAAPLWLDNFSKDFLPDNVKKTGLYGYVYDFTVDYDSIDVANIINC